VTPTTYFMRGSGHHKDSLDYDFQIEQGEFMMFSSGKGAIHMEETGGALVESGGVLHGFQKVVMGELFGHKSNVETLSPAFYYHIELEPDARLDIPTDPTHNAFAYVVEGDVEIADQKNLGKNQIALYERGRSKINLYSREGASLFILGGQPLDEVVYSYGPFVMNNAQQINQCIHNYNTGLMGDPSVVNKS